MSDEFDEDDEEFDEDADTENKFANDVLQLIDYKEPDRSDKPACSSIDTHKWVTDGWKVGDKFGWKDGIMRQSFGCKLCGIKIVAQVEED